MKLTLLLVASLFFISANAQMSGAGPIAYYPFTGNAHDESGNGHDGVVTGATLTTDRFGRLNHAYAFDAGMSNMISASIPNLPIGASPRSINVWVKWKGDPFINAAHIANYGPSTDGNAFGVMVYIPRNWWGYGYNAPAGYDLNTNVAADTAWHMLTYTYGFASGEVRFWLDGHLIAHRITTLNTKLTNFVMGGRPDSSSDCFYPGKIDDVGIYNYELDSTQINTLYTTSPVDIISVSKQANTFIIFPNPSSGSINISGIVKSANIQIFDMTGRCVSEKRISKGQSINVAHLTSATYQITITEENRVQSIKFSKL